MWFPWQQDFANWRTWGCFGEQAADKVDIVSLYIGREGRQVLNSDRDLTGGISHISSGPLEDVDNHPGLLS